MPRRPPSELDTVKKRLSRWVISCFRKLLVQKAVQEAIKSRQQRTEITQDKVLGELGKVAFSKAADYADSTLKYSNKLRALELLGKHLGMFEGKKEDTGGEVQIIDDL